MTDNGRGPGEFELPDFLKLRVGALGERLPVVFVEGELDLAAAEGFERVLRKATSGGRAVIVDLSACTFIDSSGIASLLRGASAGNGSTGTALGICAAAGAVQRTLELTAVGRLIPMFATPEEAARALGPD